MVHNYIASCMCSFLGSGLEFSLSLLSAMITLLEPELTALLGGVMGLHILGQRLEDGLVLGGRKFIDGSVIILLLVGQSGRGESGIVDESLLRLVLFPGEQDELRLVGGESSNVLGLHLGTLVASSVINSNTNSSGKSRGESGELNFLKSESSAKLDLGSVLLSAGMNDRSQVAKRSGRDSSSLLSSLIASNLLMSGLVEETFDTPHPVLSEMRAL